MHSLYAIADIGNGPELLKLYVEETYNPNLKDDTNRAYQLQNIEKKQSKVRSSQLPASSIIQTTSARTISDLYSHVKQYNKIFHPGKEVSAELLNEDGTPKELYHQTENNFTAFDTRHEGAGTGGTMKHRSEYL